MGKIGVLLKTAESIIPALAISFRLISGHLKPVPHDSSMCRVRYLICNPIHFMWTKF